MKDIAIVYALFGDHTAAEAAATQIVERRLAACANVQARCLSVYRWQGAMERTEEVPVLFKTSLHRREALTAALAEAHAYDVPAISSWTGSTTDAYADWVEAETSVQI